MAVKPRRKSKTKPKKILVRIVTIVVASVMVGGILLSALLSRLY